MKNQLTNSIFWSNLIKDSSSEDGSFNLVSNCLDKFIGTITAKKIAVRFIPKKWSPEDNNTLIELTYEEITEKSFQFAHGLKKLGALPGDILYSVSNRIPELFIISLGTLRSGTIFSSLFSSFGPEPIKNRLNKGRGKFLFCRERFFEENIFSHFSEDDLPFLETIILLGSDKKMEKWGQKKIIYYDDLLRESSKDYILEKTSPQDPALLHFTSGTTGEPKGALHIHQAQIYQAYTGKEILGLNEDDIFWCTADPGWVTGISYGIIAPLSLGATVILDEDEFNAQRWYSILSHFKVTNWYTSPTALRMLMRSGEQLANNFNLSSVKRISSVGEPLNPEVITWVQKHLRITALDNWWQTETGGIIIGNHTHLQLKLGSMGKPVSHVEVKIIKSHENGEIVFSRTNEVGEIAVKKGWPSMFVNYLFENDRYEKSFEGDWYLSGDLGRLDEEGYFWFVGRKDDVIKTSGHLVGPFEIENALMTHPFVHESAVIGLPDPLIGEKIIAFVSPKTSEMTENDLKKSLLFHVRKKLGPVISPKEIKFMSELPKTKSGKMMRRYLRAQELNLPLGDLSTMEKLDN